MSQWKLLTEDKEVSPLDCHSDRAHSSSGLVLLEIDPGAWTSTSLLDVELLWVERRSYSTWSSSTQLQLFPILYKHTCWWLVSEAVSRCWSSMRAVLSRTVTLESYNGMNIALFRFFNDFDEARHLGHSLLVARARARQDLPKRCPQSVETIECSPDEAMDSRQIGHSLADPTWLGRLGPQRSTTSGELMASPPSKTG